MSQYLINTEYLVNLYSKKVNLEEIYNSVRFFNLRNMNFIVNHFTPNFFIWHSKVFIKHKQAFIQKWMKDTNKKQIIKKTKKKKQGKVP